MSLNVGVVGAGIVGLSAAINVQKLIRRVKVTIIADKFGRETSTPITPGIFLPIPSNVRGVSHVTASEWLTDSWRHHYELAKTVGAESGHYFVRGTCLWSESDDPKYLLPNLVINHRELTEEELKDFDYKYGCEVTTVVVDQSIYLPWLMKEFRERGGEIICNTVYALQELYGRYDVVVNCTGNRGRETVQDPYLVPVKGHAVQVKDDWQRRFLITDDQISIIPFFHIGRVDVGFVMEPDVYDQQLDEEAIEQLMEKIKTVAPNIARARILKKYAERCPYRSPPLLQVDMVNCGGPFLPVVHNIGMGQEKVSFAWGTGLVAAELVMKAQRLITPFPHVCQPFNTLA